MSCFQHVGGADHVDTHGVDGIANHGIDPSDASGMDHSVGTFHGGCQSRQIEHVSFDNSDVWMSMKGASAKSIAMEIVINDNFMLIHQAVNDGIGDEASASCDEVCFHE